MGRGGYHGGSSIHTVIYDEEADLARRKAHWKRKLAREQEQRDAAAERAAKFNLTATDLSDDDAAWLARNYKAQHAACERINSLRQRRRKP